MTAGHQRLDVDRVDPKAHQAVLATKAYVHTGGLDPRLYELVNIRAPQISGCAFCPGMHDRDARKAGQDQRRLDGLCAWRDAPELFTDVEQAGLALSAAVTRIGDAGVPVQVCDDVTRYFDEPGIVHPLQCPATINVWNRRAITMRRRLADVSVATRTSSRLGG